jgi:hypothetical protein
VLPTNSDSGPVLELIGKRGDLESCKNERLWNGQRDLRLLFFGQYESRRRRRRGGGKRRRR